MTRHRIAIVDVFGKFNFHRYIVLLERFGIPYGLILDDDEDRTHHKAVNDMLRHRAGPCRLADPVFDPKHMEAFLGLALPGRDELKPVKILAALEAGDLDGEKLSALKEMFSKALALPREPAAL